ncbi:hypothetical protein [Deinococcus enclensis]|uniref:Uncharacterized protein n=1 Tax=Deinococcus enclensis TaxID=1049582 RepID=A0ABT9MFC0_9DEIO|nr:hypothetical protein [Deinococcus enclensis]MDP9764894.1 hypothetical protein [Deinococcus enclensis]
MPTIDNQYAENTRVTAVKAQAEALLREARRGQYAHIVWVPHGLECEAGATRIPLGVMVGNGAGDVALGLLDYGVLPDVHAVLGGAMFSELDQAFVASIAERRLTPREARDAFPGMQVSCYQTWHVTEPRPLALRERTPRDVLPAMWHRSSAFPLVQFTTWTAATQEAQP